jgi:peptidoglycan hydrolase CwlO-like protein
MYQNVTLSKYVVILLVSILATSCVSNKKYTELVQERDRMDLGLEKAHKEIKDLREIRFNQEDQIHNFKENAAKMEQQNAFLRKSNDEFTAKYNALNEEVRQLTAQLNTNKGEQTAIVSGYEQKITEMQKEIEAATKARMSRKSYGRRRTASVVRKLSLPAALKL